MSPAFSDFTPSDVLASRYSLAIHCPKCRELRDVGNRLAVLVETRGDQPLREMVFRCQACGGPGTPHLSWRDAYNTPRSFDFARLCDDEA